MNWWRRRKKMPSVPDGLAEERIRQKYQSFRELLALNSECLELMAGLQEDLQYVPPRRDVLGGRVADIFSRASGVVDALNSLTGSSYASLQAAVEAQRNEVERYVAACQELTTPRLSGWLSEFGLDAVAEVGGKAAYLGEIKNKLGLPVPDGYVLTTEAYRRFCGIPLWEQIRDAVQEIDLNELDSLSAISARLVGLVMEAPLPRAVEVAVSERALHLSRDGQGLAVRSSAVGEGGERTYAGQFLTLLNVPPDKVVDAYRAVVAGRFSERALSYRVSTGLLEIESPLAVLFLPVIKARAAGIMYSRDPAEPRSKNLWITATQGLGLDVASGGTPADLFVVSRRSSHPIVERQLVEKREEIVLSPEGGIARRAVAAAEAGAPSLPDEIIRTLASWAVRLEDHFGSPQDVEWAVDESGNPWILQSRPLALVEVERRRLKAHPKAEPLLVGGRTVYPGRVSGPAYLARGSGELANTPEGAVLFLRQASPEIVPVLPRVSGLVAEWGNVTGHAAALLREFKVPSVFLTPGVFDKLHDGDPVSLDAVQAKVYAGAFWPTRQVELSEVERYSGRAEDPVSRRLLALTLVDPSAFNFRPAGCKSTHDVLRFSHEKAVEAMFDINDMEAELGRHRCRQLVSDLPVHLYVLDLGGGLRLDDEAAQKVRPEQIVSRPFQGLWKGISHPAVTWTRQMPAGLGDLASVMAGSFSAQSNATRALGEKSYLLVAGEYMNLNSRLAYHFSLVDACLSEVSSNNYISFRFSGGGATRFRRNLRARLIETVLRHYGFQVDRRGDLVNAWFKRAPAEKTEANLDILGRLMASTSQLDMYMTSHDAMNWYVRQFLEGNYLFRTAAPEKAEGRESHS